MYKFTKNGRDYSQVRKQVVELFKEGKKVKEIAKILNIDRHISSRYVKEAGYFFSPCGKIGINSNIFKTIDTEEKAYWAGFMFADGSMSDKNSVELSLKLSDFEHLEKFKKFLSYEGNVRKDSFRCRLQFSDSNIANDLKKIGCTARKSLTLKFPSEDKIPKELLGHFLRGYVEGDGHIAKKKGILISIAGTEEFLTKITEILKVEKIPKKSKSKAYTLTLCGDNARKLCSLMYESCLVYLDRKYKIYIENKERWYGKS